MSEDTVLSHLTIEWIQLSDFSDILKDIDRHL
jgi:hypothetical protein